MLVLSLHRKINVGISFALLLVGFSIVSKPAFGAQALSLEQAIKETLKHNPALHQFDFRENFLKAQKQTQVLRPAYEVSAEVENVAGTGDTSEFSAAETTIALSSVLELGSKRQARVSLADSRLEHLRWQQQATTIENTTQKTKTK